MKRRLSVLLTVLLAAAACSPAGSQDDDDGSAGTPATVVVARTSDVNELDPHKATAFQTVSTLGLVYDRLVTVNDKGELRPGLATEWQSSDAGRTLTFTLRENVTWHNGEAFTGADVKASLERVLDETTAAVARSNLTAIERVEAEGQEVTLRLAQPSTALLHALTSLNAAILQADDISAGTVGKKPNGTGPYAWKSWKQGQNVTLTANKGYFGGAPAARGLEFRVIPSESSILSGMKAGTFHLGLVTDPAVAGQAKDSKRFSLAKKPALAYHTLMLNSTRGPLKKRQVRQAIACAVDPGQVIDTASNGDGVPTGPITSPAFSYDIGAGLPCRPGDIAAARKHLADAGEGDGFSLTTIVQTDGYATAGAIAQNLQAQLDKIGVRLKLEQQPVAAYVDTWAKADFDAAVALNGGSYDPYLMYGRYFGEGGSLAGPAGLVSGTLAELLATGDKSADEGEREKTYRKLQRQLLTESPWVWLYRGDDYYLVGDRLPGFAPRADGHLTGLAVTAGKGAGS